MIASALNPNPVFSGAGALVVEIPKDQYEFARGDNITLPCSFTPENTDNPLTIITWTAEGTKPGSLEVRFQITTLA